MFSSSSGESSAPESSGMVNVGTHNSVTLLNESRMLAKTQILRARRTQNPKSLQRNKSDIPFYTGEEATEPAWKPSHHILIMFIWGT